MSSINILANSLFIGDIISSLMVYKGKLTYGKRKSRECLPTETNPPAFDLKSIIRFNAYLSPSGCENEIRLSTSTCAKLRVNLVLNVAIRMIPNF